MGNDIQKMLGAVAICVVAVVVCLAVGLFTFPPSGSIQASQPTDNGCDGPVLIADTNGPNGPSEQREKGRVVEADLKGATAVKNDAGACQRH